MHPALIQATAAERTRDHYARAAAHQRAAQVRRAGARPPVTRRRRAAGQPRPADRLSPFRIGPRDKARAAGLEQLLPYVL